MAAPFLGSIAVRARSRKVRSASVFHAILAAVSEDLKFRVIEGAGHWVIYEAAHEVNAALVELLTRHSLEAGRD
jgi:pimeloyl-ACP methyl ester carboxylesterase